MPVSEMLFSSDAVLTSHLVTRKRNAIKRQLRNRSQDTPAMKIEGRCTAIAEWHRSRIRVSNLR